MQKHPPELIELYSAMTALRRRQKEEKSTVEQREQQEQQRKTPHPCRSYRQKQEAEEAEEAVQAEAAGGKSQSSSSTYDAMTEDDLLPVRKYLDGNVAWMQLACGAKIDASCYYPGPDGFATAKWGDADVAFCYTWETDTLNEYISSDGKRLEIPKVVEPKGEKSRETER